MGAYEATTASGQHQQSETQHTDVQYHADIVNDDDCTNELQTAAEQAADDCWSATTSNEVISRSSKFSTTTNKRPQEAASKLRQVVAAEPTTTTVLSKAPKTIKCQQCRRVSI